MNIYDENGLIPVPVGASPEWIQALCDERIPKDMQKTLIRKAEKLAEEAQAEKTLADTQNAKDNRRSATLRALTETEINQSAMLSLDHVKGLMLVAQKLQAVVDKHTDTQDGHQKRGNINTVLDYIIAHIELLEGVKISKKPLHDLRAVHTEKQADTCGISHKNLTLIWKCLLSIQKSGDAIPLGDEVQLFDRARAMAKHVEAEKKAQDDANQTLSAANSRKNRLDAHKQGRHTFFPDLSVYSDHEFLGEIYRKVQEKGEEGAEIADREPLGIKDGAGAKKAAQRSRTADRGSRESKLYKENKELIRKINRK